MLRRMLRADEIPIAVSIMVLSLGIGLVNPAYFSLANLFDMLRGATVYGILAMGVLVILISGGVDVSFAAIAAASSYIAVKILLAADYRGPMLLVYLTAAPVGLLMGMLNATVINFFRLPALIVTLGTASIYYGSVLFFVGDVALYRLPEGMVAYRLMSLVTVDDPRAGTSSLHPSVLLLAASAGIVYILLRYTMIGRGVYAIGGNRAVAERSGFNVRQVEYVIYGMVGVLASAAGITQAALYRNANPAALMGAELEVIAAVVLGGASVTGGLGSVPGALLGLFLIIIMKSGLVLLGIPSEWQKVAVGIALILGTTIPAIRSRRRNRRVTLGRAE